METETQVLMKSWIRSGLTAPEIGNKISRSSTYIRQKTKELGEDFYKMLMANAKEKQARSRKYASFWGRCNGIKG